MKQLDPVVYVDRLGPVGKRAKETIPELMKDIGGEPDFGIVLLIRNHDNQVSIAYKALSDLEDPLLEESLEKSGELSEAVNRVLLTHYKALRSLVISFVNGYREGLGRGRLSKDEEDMLDTVFSHTAADFIHLGEEE